MHATIVLTALELPLDLGTYSPDDVKPDAHLLDMTLTIDPALALVPGDAMTYVFDYDPLIAEIDHLARDGHYDTQEWLMTRIALACAAYPVIWAVELHCYKRPVWRREDGSASGALGVTISLNRDELDAMIG